MLLDCAALGCGLPAKALRPDELRALLLRRGTAWITKDAVWAELVERAQAIPDPWTTVAAGMMRPGLRHIVTALRGRFPVDHVDLESEVVAGFLQELDLAEARTPRIYAQLHGAARRRGHEVCRRELRSAGRSEPTGTVRRHRPAGGHPDIVLAEAMRSGVVTPQQADLVSHVLIDDNDRSTAARRLGMSRYQVAAQLDTAADQLAEYLCHRTAAAGGVVSAWHEYGEERP
ncbi:hypothetical protein [Saccharothrix australiensis]|uniref:hypothetical protein n=1 Tax=Saccharothrix australiensis TaxID=2072 RepID=UPI000EB02C1D|nr:hypothetical protein [Saccharothrix australiensis]